MITKREILEKLVTLEAILLDTNDDLAKLERKVTKLAKELKNETKK